MQLSERELQSYADDGFVIRKALFHLEEIAEIGRSLDRLEAIAKTLRQTTLVSGTQFVVHDQHIDRVVWCGAAEPGLLRIGENRRLLVPIGQILQVHRVQQLICQAHFKLPGDGVAFPWHQDSQHRGYGTMDWQDVGVQGSYVQTIICVDPMGMDNGPLKVLPGSHRHGHLGLEHEKNLHLLAVEGAHTLKMDPGDVLFFGPYLVHGSEPNTSGRARRILINGFAHPEANRRIYPGQGSGRFLDIPAEPRKKAA